MAHIVTFHKIYPAAIPPMRADPSALGALPSAAFQYCEAVRSASAFGWYVFPPKEIRLVWDGADVFYDSLYGWQRLTSVHLENDFLDHWDAHAPSDLEGCAPPYLSMLSVPGNVQIWSGLLVSTRKDWSVVVRAPVNSQQSPKYACYDGLIETDEFAPCPLFINIRMIATDVEIVIPAAKPLFQIQPVHRQSYADASLNSYGLVDLDPEVDGAERMSAADWNGYRNTTRGVDRLTSQHQPGSYGARVRRRKKHDRNCPYVGSVELPVESTK